MHFDPILFYYLVRPNCCVWLENGWYALMLQAAAKNLWNLWLLKLFWEKLILYVLHPIKICCWSVTDIKWRHRKHTFLWQKVQSHFFTFNPLYLLEVGSDSHRPALQPFGVRREVRVLLVLLYLLFPQKKNYPWLKVFPAACYSLSLLLTTKMIDLAVKKDSERFI